jgi:hypothetical protein
MLLGDDFRFTEALLDRTADEGVTVFVEAYGFFEK